MRRFHFRLERLFEIRSYREQQWLAKLAAASGLCTRLSHKITENGEAARGAFYIDSRRGQELDLSMLTYREHYINRLGQEQRKLKRELEEKLQARAQVLEKYQEVSRDKKVLEKLKEKRESDYYARAKLDEFKAVDDLTSSQFVRKSLEGGI
ncbi:MAG: flagellar FliJ family protein [Spirochaetaceae bacterium]|nr:MAG: flagellar FliJ family protein [Spirochaetaceae bacterium]